MDIGNVCLVTTTSAVLVRPTVGCKTKNFINKAGIIMEKNAPHSAILNSKPWYVVFIQGELFNIREDAMKEVLNGL
jgi:hypothetical protein